MDTGASDLFMSKMAAEKLGLEVEGSTKKIKTVNAKEVPVVGTVRKVELQIGEWKAKEDFKVIHLDDFDFVLGLNFLDRVQALIIPCADVICILDPKQHCVVPVYRDKGRRIEKLTSIQLTKDAPREGGIALEAIGVDTLVGQELPEPHDSEPVGDPSIEEMDEASSFNEDGASMGASNFTSEERLMRVRVNAEKLIEVHPEHNDCVLQFDLPCLSGVGQQKPNPSNGVVDTWREHKPPFRVLRRKRGLPTILRDRSVFNVVASKSLCKDHVCPNGGKSQLVGANSYDRDALGGTVTDVRWRRVPKQAVHLGGQLSQSRVLFMRRASSPIQSLGQAEVTRNSQDRFYLRSEAATRASPCLVGENVTGRQFEPVPHAHIAAQEVLREILGLKVPPDLARSMEDSRR